VDATTILLLAGTGLAGGIVTAIVGGSSLITFPAMLAAGLPPLIAVASNTVALTPSTFVAAATDRQRLPAWKPEFRRVIGVALGGSGAGALLLILTPERALMALVPLLIGLATVLFALSGRIRAWIFRHGDDPQLHSARADRLGLILLVPTSVYAGYFGAGASVMLLAILSLGHTGDLRNVNALKNLLSGLTGVVAVIIFIVTGMVAWPHTLAMAAGALAGGYAGARLARVIPAAFLRWLIIGVGCMFTVIYARRHWF
jgi:uncharacterized membrane protein YfcA